MHKDNTHKFVFFFFFFSSSPCEELMDSCSRTTRTNRVAWRIEREESIAPAQRMTIRDTEKISLTHAQGDTQF